MSYVSLTTGNVIEVAVVGLDTMSPIKERHPETMSARRRLEDSPSAVENLRPSSLTG